MKGKKFDPEFVARYIQECITTGIHTPEDIVKKAKATIISIDDEIKAIEIKKSHRSKLLDVISSFEKTTKDKSEDAKLLPFFKIEKIAVCKTICDMVKIVPLKADRLGIEDKFVVKQLLEAKVLANINGLIIRGDHFDEYMKFVLCEVE